MAEKNLGSRLGRRDMLKAFAGIGAAGVAAAALPALVLLPNQGNSPKTDGMASSAPAMTANLTEPLVAYIKDASKGEVVIMSGFNEFTITDHDLVARLAGAVGV